MKLSQSFHLRAQVGKGVSKVQGCRHIPLGMQGIGIPKLGPATYPISVDVQYVGDHQYIEFIDRRVNSLTQDKSAAYKADTVGGIGVRVKKLRSFRGRGRNQLPEKAFSAVYSRKI